MKTISAPLRTLLDSGVFLMADALAITRASLVALPVLYYTTYDQDFTYGGHVYKSSELIIHRSNVSWKNDLSVDSMEFDITPKNYTGFLADLKFGVFNNAQVELDRMFFAPGPYSSTPTPVGSILIFLGNIGDVEADRSQATITVNSFLERLNVPVPREVYQSSCVNPFGGYICRASSKTFNGTVLAVNGAQNNNLSINLYDALSLFVGGYVLWLTGANAGLSQTINYSLAGTMVLLEPMRYPIAPGDTFTVYTSCDHTVNYCANLYGNLANYKGFKNIPTVGTFGG